MDILTRMGEKFDSKEIRYARYVASKFFLDARNYWAGELEPDVTQDAAIRDILNFFEQMAHYANAEGIDEEMMLNAYYFGMEAYWHFAERSFLSKDYASSLEWTEIRKLREKAPQWLRKEYVRHMPDLYESEDNVPEEKVQVASRDVLAAVLKREVARCKGPRRSAASNRLAIDRLV